LAVISKFNWANEICALKIEDLRGASPEGAVYISDGCQAIVFNTMGYTHR